MKKRDSLFHDVSIRIVKLINLVLMTTPFIFVWYRFYADQLWVKFFMRGHWLVIALFVLLYYTIGKVYEAFKISYSGIGEMVYSQMLALFEVDIIMYIIAWLLIRRAPLITPMLGAFAVQTVVAIVWSYLSQKWYFKTFPADRTVIIWDMRDEISPLIKRYHLEKKYRVVDTVTAQECIKNLSIIENTDTVFLVGVHSHDRNIISKYCLMNGIKAFLIPRVGDLIVASAKSVHMLHLPILKIDRNNLSYEFLIIKRLSDILFALIGLIVSSPLMLIIAICIKAEDGGPIIFKQTRLTKGRREFDILKFRSMKVDAEDDGLARLSSGEEDDRITRVGRFIRRTRLDELPNFINIIKGDISFVGPRGERPELAEEYEREIPEFALRLQVKAGLTGYAQVYGKYNTNPYDKLLMDLTYIANASIFEDLRILFLTIKILFMPDSTEGVDPDKRTAM